MLGFSTLLSGVLMFALLIIPGYILGRIKMIERGALNSMTNILMYVAMPFLVFTKLIATDLYAIDPIHILLAALSPFVVFGAIMLLSEKTFRAREGDRRYRASRFCSIFSNAGFLGIPLSEVLFPDRPEISVYVSLFNVGSTFFLLTVGVYILSGDRRDISFRRAILSPIMASIVIGVLFSLLGVVDYVPKVANYADILASLTTPLSMIVLGVEMSGIPFSAFVKTPLLYLVSFMKLVLSPLVMIAILLLLGLCGLAVPSELQAALFIATAVSSAASSSAMTKKYGGDGEYAAILTIGTTLLCAVSFPLLYLLASALLGW